MTRQRSLVLGVVLCLALVAVTYAADTPIRIVNSSNEVIYVGYTENGHWHGIKELAPGATYGVANPPSGSQLAISARENDLEPTTKGGKAVFKPSPYGYVYQYFYPNSVTVLWFDGRELSLSQQGRYLATTQHAQGSGCSSNSQYNECYYGYISLPSNYRATLIDPPVGKQRQIGLDSTFTEQFPANTDPSTIELVIYENRFSDTSRDLAAPVDATADVGGTWNVIPAVPSAYDLSDHTLTWTPTGLDPNSIVKLETRFRAYGTDVVSISRSAVTTRSTTDHVILALPANAVKVMTSTPVNFAFTGPGAPSLSGVNSQTVKLSQILADGSGSLVQYDAQVIVRGNAHTLSLKPRTEFAANARVSVALDGLPLTDGTVASLSRSFQTTTGEPFIVLPYPLDEMPLDGTIEIQFPSAAVIERSSVNSNTFKVTDAVTNQMLPGAYHVRGNVMTFAGDRQWMGGQRVAVTATNILNGNLRVLPEVRFVATAVAVPVVNGVPLPRIIYEATNRGAGYTAAGAGGLRDADYACNTDPNKPVDPPNVKREYRALLGSGGLRQARPAPENLRWGFMSIRPSDTDVSHDWVLLPNTFYVDRDLQPIGTTDSNGLFFGTLANPIDRTATLGSWSGLSDTWGIQIGGDALNCFGWTGANDRYYMASLGDHRSTNVRRMLYSTEIAVCSERHSFACAQK